jgi:DNA-binding IscR family transcriptional regulator
MTDCGTVIVFRILGMLAQARSVGHVLVLDDIANALSLGREPVEQYLAVLQQAGAVRAESGASHAAHYSLTRYGLERVGGRVPH